MEIRFQLNGYPSVLDTFKNLQIEVSLNSNQIKVKWFEMRTKFKRKFMIHQNPSKEKKLQIYRLPTKIPAS